MSRTSSARIKRLEDSRIDHEQPPSVFYTLYEGQVPQTQSALLSWPDGTTEELLNTFDNDADFRMRASAAIECFPVLLFY